MPPESSPGAGSAGPPDAPIVRCALGWLYTAALWSIPLSGLILYVFARTAMSPAVGALVGWHILGGLGLSVPFLIWLRRSGASIRPDVRRALAVSVALTLGTGAALVVWAACGRSIGKLPLLFAGHVTIGSALTALAGVLVIQAVRGRQHATGTRLRASAAIACALLVLAGGALGAYTYEAEGYYRMLTASSAADTGSARFPGGTQIERAPAWRGAPGPDSCARDGCHPGAERSWRASAHAHAARGPYYQAALRYTVEHIGKDGARWCEGCHSPLASAAPGESAVGCYACHAIRRIPVPAGNGYAVYAPPAEYPFAERTAGAGRALHDFLMRVRPGPHQADMAGPRDSASGAAMCEPCHRMSVNAQQNHYKFVRYDTTWTEWQAGPYSGESVHGFGAQGPRLTCADCHFRHQAGVDIAGVVRDHGCPGLQTTTQDNVGNPNAGNSNGLNVEVFAVRRGGAEPGSAERIDAPLKSRPVVVRAGETIWVDVLVENTGIGHAFPTGVPDLRDVWLEFRVESPGGRTLVGSGIAQTDTGEAPGAHRYGLVALDREGNTLYRGNVFAMVGQAYRFAEGNGHGRALRYRMLLPGIGDVARYRFRVPGNGSHELVLVAKLLYRPYNRSFAQWVSLVTPRPGASRLASPMTTVLAEDREVIGVREPGNPASVPSPQYGRQRDDPRDAPRLVAYGAALLMQNDVPRARRAFAAAISLAPGSADAWTALGRAFLEEGDLLAAQAKLQHALEMDPANPRAGVWLGRTYRLMGKYGLALRMLEPLAQRFPRDGLTWLDIGLCRFQSGHPDEAVAAFQRMLGVDPDDPVAHLNLMQCYRRLLRISDARREEVIYRTLQDTDLPSSIVDAYMRAHPEVRLEAQPVHEHILVAAPRWRHGDTGTRI